MNSNIYDAMANAIERCSAILVLVTRTYKESGNCKLELTFALKCKKKVIPLLAEHGYEFEVDGWSGMALGALLYYDISNPEHRKSQLKALLQKELQVKSSSSSSAILPDKDVPIHKQVVIPSTEKELRDWVAMVGLDSVVADAMIQQDFVGVEHLRILAENSAPDIQKLLRLEKGLVAAKLKSALNKLVS